MALTYPLSLAQFAEKLNIASVIWQLKEQQQLTGLGSGEILAANMAPPRVEAQVDINPMYHEDAAEVQALIEALDGALGTFYLHSPQKAYPRMDPTGSILGASSVTIDSLVSNNKEMRLAGLPAGYVLSGGDLLSFNYGTNPVRRALHRIVLPVTASGTGVTPLFEVRPYIRPGAATGLAVTLIKAAAKVKMIPDSFNPGTNDSDGITRGMSFQVRQTL
ncbi:hypothetical protein M8997_004065 [Phyllobacterium sp. 21LDTY02-6]|uniref:hypothetical protein n=1 Tax=Phyllobacterium sp. 21LDTY02-6 TaxID=2944903 RepID=UPI0020221BBA|nr:hypothetical protein [Phyllobacterium sp. 21LDTY02-6]MCO4316348.1 hypothetical protein [Phyllobacterium sp. 21LDTY02-6]